MRAPSGSISPATVIAAVIVAAAVKPAPDDAAKAAEAVAAVPTRTPAPSGLIAVPVDSSETRASIDAAAGVCLSIAAFRVAVVVTDEASD